MYSERANTITGNKGHQAQVHYFVESKLALMSQGQWHWQGPTYPQYSGHHWMHHKTWAEFCFLGTAISTPNLRPMLNRLRYSTSLVREMTCCLFDYGKMIPVFANRVRLKTEHFQDQMIMCIEYPSDLFPLSEM